VLKNELEGFVLFYLCKIKKILLNLNTLSHDVYLFKHLGYSRFSNRIIIVH